MARGPVFEHAEPCPEFVHIGLDVGYMAPDRQHELEYQITVSSAYCRSAQSSTHADRLRFKPDETAGVGGSFERTQIVGGFTDPDRVDWNAVFFG
jgi:hypothetical protein